ncbi:hypothetical protein FE257_000304 [Aspergillus nanangensis]|uniref:tRNA-splicing endonuclease subunit Sen15 domain-containing protein n=1 Tax=Aspergillus nanangensis TaxID=2582783 RepID=A0AAD4D0W5_ASPNN|nr:hypothetical protein FE257_000304 [Aspergillus nanangensis]
MESTVPTHPEPSALTALISNTSAPSNPYSATTLQILHNLEHQHLWTSLQVHNLEVPSADSESPSLSHFLISGIPPHRVYTHPDEQLYMLEKGLRDEDVDLERMFVLPTAQGQSWSLRRMAAVFDSLADPAEEFCSLSSSAGNDAEDRGTKANSEKAAKLAEYYERRTKAFRTREWGGKRILLAMVDKGMGGDGTVVYYIVQEGAVKPRQN